MSSLKNKLKNLGISQKFICSLMIFQVIPLLLLFMVVTFQQRSSLNSKACDINLEILKQTKAGLESFIRDVENVSLNIAADGNVQEIIRMYGKKGKAEELEKRKVELSYQMRIEMESHRNIKSMSIFKPGAVILQIGDYVLREDEQMIPRLNELEGLPLWTTLHEGETVSYNAPYEKLYLLRAVNDLNTMEIIAYERITVDEASLREQYTGILSGKSRLFITDQDGRILSSSDDGCPGMAFTKLGYGELPEGNAGYFEDGDAIISYYNIDTAGWRIVKVDDSRDILQSSNALYYTVLLCILLTLIFGVVFYTVQKKTMIQPIQQLSRETEAFTEERFQIGIYDDSEDEIGVLNRNLAEMVAYIHNLIQTQYMNEIKRKEIELKYMQSQINPHFLYNTLDSIRWMAVVEHNDEIARQVEALSDVFRHALNRGNEMVTVKQEVEHLKSYLCIQKNRFGERIRVSIRVEQELEECRVQKLILQPLVENAFVHGLEKKVGGGSIWVKVQREGQVLLYIVEDDGAGSDAGEINRYLKEEKESGNVFALKNIDERLKMKYGNDCGITFYSRENVGTRVEVRMLPEQLSDGI